MKRMLMRPVAAVLPLLLLLTLLLNPASLVAQLSVNWLVMQLATLAVVDCFRNAAAREPGPRRVDRLFWGTLPQLILGAGVAAWLILRVGLPFPLITLAAWLMIIEQLFEERLFTLNRRSDGSILGLISAALIFAGLMLDGKNGLPNPLADHPLGGEGFYTCCAAALSAAIGVLSALIIAPSKSFSLYPACLNRMLIAAVQGLLFPMCCVFYAAYYYHDAPVDESFVRLLLPGLALWRLSRTVCRRTADESRSLNLLLVSCTAAMLAAAAFVEGLLPPAMGCLLALICAMIVFLRPGWRNLSATALLIIAAILTGLGLPLAGPAAIALGLAAIAINLKHAFLRKVS